MRRIGFMLLLMATMLCCNAQSCYRETLKQGVNEFKRKHYKNAKNIFSAARVCPDIPKNNSIDYWLQQCNLVLKKTKKRKIETLSEKLSKYEFVGTEDFFDGLCMVYIKTDESGHDIPKVGFIDKNADLVIPCKYISPDEQNGGGCSYFSEGLVAVAVLDDKGNQVQGYIDTKGKVVIPFQYAKAYPFEEGYAGVLSADDVKDDVWYYHFIDKKGNTVLTGKYVSIGSNDGYNGFHKGICAVKFDTNKWGIINKKGDLIVPAKYDYMYVTEDYGVIAFDGDLVCRYNTKGEIIENLRKAEKNKSKFREYDYVYHSN